jgi:hypothetical protein
MSKAVPPERSTRRISDKAFTGSLKFLKAARQTTKSKLPLSNGRAAALPTSNCALLDEVKSLDCARSVPSEPTCAANRLGQQPALLVESDDVPS